MALKDISFNIKEGEFVAIIGLSGSGKSTLLRTINKLIPIDSGEINFNNTNIQLLDGINLREKRSQIGMIFQHFNLIPRMSVLTNVLMGSLFRTSILNSLFNIFKVAEKEKAKKLLKIVGLKNKAHNRASQLSGGEQQRVAIARALMQNPKILLADEPVASLDPATSHSVMQYLKKANTELGVTIICNLHFLSLVREYATRVIALKEGQLIYDGNPNEIDEAWFKKIYGEDAKNVSIN